MNTATKEKQSVIRDPLDIHGQRKLLLENNSYCQKILDLLYQIGDEVCIDCFFPFAREKTGLIDDGVYRKFIQMVDKGIIGINPQDQDHYNHSASCFITNDCLDYVTPKLKKNSLKGEFMTFRGRETWHSYHSDPVVGYIPLEIKPVFA